MLLLLLLILQAGLWLFACLGDYMAASAGGCKASADAVAVALQRCLMDESKCCGY
jgi:hypothetical protein